MPGPQLDLTPLTSTLWVNRYRRAPGGLGWAGMGRWGWLPPGKGVGEEPALPGAVCAHQSLRRGLCRQPRGAAVPPCPFLFLLGTGDSVAQPHQLRAHIQALHGKETGPEKLSARESGAGAQPGRGAERRGLTSPWRGA